MATDPETQQGQDGQYQFDNFPRFLEGMREAMVMLSATPCVDKSGQLRFVTLEGQVCCPVTLVDLHVNRIETPVNLVNRVLKRQKPLVPPHLLEVIRNAADNRHILPYWVISGGSPRPTFELDVQHELDRVAGILGARRHRMTPQPTMAAQVA